PLVEARVLAPYGEHDPGSVVKVTERELRRVPWALKSVEQEEAERAQAKSQQAADQAKREEQRRVFDTFRRNLEQSSEIARTIFLEQRAQADAIVEKRVEELRNDAMRDGRAVRP